MRAAVLALAAGLSSRAFAQTTKANTLAKDTRACQGAFASLPYCDTTKPLDDRVNDFIARLWASPNAATIIPPQLTARHGGGGSPGPTDAVPELGLPEFDWGLNCIHGVQSSCVEDGAGVHCPTSFMVRSGAGWVLGTDSPADSRACPRSSSPASPSPPRPPCDVASAAPRSFFCVCDGNAALLTPASVSPQNPVNFGSTWNASLGRALGEIIATETRALWLAGAVEESDWSGRPHIGLDVWSPNINIARDPRWGA